MDFLFSSLNDVMLSQTSSGTLGSGAVDLGITASPSMGFEGQLSQVLQHTNGVSKGSAENFGIADSPAMGADSHLVRVLQNIEAPGQNIDARGIGTGENTESTPPISMEMDSQLSKMVQKAEAVFEGSTENFSVTGAQAMKVEGQLVRKFQNADTGSRGIAENVVFPNQNVEPQDGIRGKINNIRKGEGGAPSTSLINRLENVIQRIRSGSEPNAFSGFQGLDIDALESIEMSANTVGQEGGLAVVVGLQQIFLSLSGGDLETLSINSDGLEALGNVLEQAGFSQEKIGELMDELELSLEDEEDTIPVSEFMDSLFELPMENREEGEDAVVAETPVLMATSTRPYLTSILTMLGVDQEKIFGIMSESSRGTSGYDLHTFVDQLRQLGEQSYNSGILYQTDAGNDTVSGLLDQLGISVETGAGGAALTLNQLIHAFEQKQVVFSARVPLTGQTTFSTFEQKQAVFSGELEERGIISQYHFEQKQAVFSAGLPVRQTTNRQATNWVDTNFSTPAAAPSGQENTPVEKQGMLTQLFSNLAYTDSDVETVPVNTDISSGQAREQIKNNFFSQVNEIPAASAGPEDELIAGTEPAADRAFLNPGKNEGMPLPGKTALFEAAKENISTATVSTDTASGYADVEAALGAGEKVNLNSTLSAASVNKADQTFRTLPDHVIQQLSKGVVRAINLGEDSLKIQLKPAELGRVFMRIDNNGDTMKVSIITEHQSAKDVLAANVNEIKTILSTSGISLERFEVDMSSNFRQSMADARSQDQSGRKRSGKNWDSGSDAEEENLTQMTAPARTQGAGGSLHFVA